MTATAPPPISATLPSGVARLSHLGVIRISGDDAASFIHGQLTQDFSLLGLDQARLAAFCSAKGRMQASFIGCKRPDGDILLVCSGDLLAATLKRLSMFVMHAKAKLTDASADFALYGLAGSAVKTVAGRPHSVWDKLDVEVQSVINLYPADGVARQLCVAPVADPVPAGALLPAETWLWGEVRSAVATLSMPVIDAFVPQMLNYESVGGVNFKKGCYPGQEVVARSQFRGTLKRRTFLVHGATPMAAGDEVFSSMDANQPAGLVVQCARAPLGGFDALISVQVNATGDATLHHGAPGGPPIELLPLPYPLLEDI